MSLEKLFKEFHAYEIPFVHFKSNHRLNLDNLEGEDLDIYIPDSFKNRAEEIIRSLYGFCASPPTNVAAENQYIRHYFLFDENRNHFIHLHIYFKMLTCGALLKNNFLELDDLIFRDYKPDRSLNGLPIIGAEADLVLLLVRKRIELRSPLERLIFKKELEDFCNEVKSLTEQIDIELFLQLMEEVCDNVDGSRLIECLKSFQRNHRVSLGNSMELLSCFGNTSNKQLYHPLWSEIIRFYRLARMLLISRKIVPLTNKKLIYGKGRVIAFVGSEASGKSTLSGIAKSEFGKEIDVYGTHMGKTEKSWLTQPAWKVINLVVNIKALYRKFLFEREYKEDGAVAMQEYETARSIKNEPHLMVSFLDAIDKYLICRRLRKRSSRGVLVVTDRYPNFENRGVEGPRIEARGILSNLLAYIEVYLYKKMEQPDAVFKLLAPLEVVLHRNANRDRVDPHDFVLARYELVKKMKFENSRVIELDVNRDLSKLKKVVLKEVIREINRA